MLSPHISTFGLLFLHLFLLLSHLSIPLRNFLDRCNSILTVTTGRFVWEFPVQLWRFWLQRLPLTRALRYFFFGSNLRLGGRQSTVTMVLTRWPREDSWRFFPVSRALGGTCRRLSRFCNILLQDLTPLHVKITRSTNLLSVGRRRLQVIDLFIHYKLQPHKLSQHTLANRVSSSWYSK